MTKGGAAKGELVLAIFELANCFRYAWGVKKDPLAARQYYETAANLGDTDAMEEAAWCFLEGFGGPKDKVGFYFLLLCFCFIAMVRSYFARALHSLPRDRTPATSSSTIDFDSQVGPPCASAYLSSHQ